MKVLHVVHKIDLRLGGVPQAVRDIIVGLSELGVTNEVVSFDEDNEMKEKLNFKLHTLGPGKGPWNYNKAFSQWLYENLPLYDVVIVHGLWLYYPYAVARSFKKHREDSTKNIQIKTRFYVMPHGMLDPYFQLATSRRLKAMRNRLYWNLIERKTISQSDGLLFTCREELLRARQTFTKYTPKQELVVGLGVQQPPSYVPEMTKKLFEKCPDLAGSRYILFLSRIDPKKGVDLLLRSYLNVLDSLSNKPNNFSIDGNITKLLIAGPGLDSSYGKEITALAKESKHSDKIIFSGMLKGNSKWGAFYNCDGFVLPSHQENFGIVVVEALACGKPVLISKQVNIWQEIDNSGCAIVDDDTIEGTERSLLKFLDSTDKTLDEISQKAKALYQSQYSLKNAANRLLFEISK